MTMGNTGTVRTTGRTALAETLNPTGTNTESNTETLGPTETHLGPPDQRDWTKNTTNSILVVPRGNTDKECTGTRTTMEVTRRTKA